MFLKLITTLGDGGKTKKRKVRRAGVWEVEYREERGVRQG